MQRVFSRLRCEEAGKNREEKESEKRRKQPKARSMSGKYAASAEAPGRSEPVTRIFLQEMDVKESSWIEVFPKKRRRKGEVTTEKQCRRKQGR